MNRRVRLLPFTLVTGLVGCGPAGTDPAIGSLDGTLRIQASDAARVLALVNYPGADLHVLHDLAGLDARAARNILAVRNGPDGVSPSGDDVYFEGIPALDAVPWVGDTALAKLLAYATAHPAPVNETVKRVLFRGWQSEAVVWAVDRLDLSVLDGLLDARAARGLVDRRPFSTVTQIASVPYVGATALNKLRGQAGAWWVVMGMNGAPVLAGTFDSVTFDGSTAKIALEIANQATAAQLTQNGVTASPANHIVAGRPYGALAQVAGVYGVGPATMTALRAYAQSGNWSPVLQGPSACEMAFDAAVQPHLADVLFLSESDRPFDIVSFPGAGAAGAPTAQSVLALVGAPVGSTAEERAATSFNDGFEASSGTADPNAAMDIEAAFAAQLTDVIYVAVHAPAGSLDMASVNVYLVGRTACGEVIGIHSVSIET